MRIKDKETAQEMYDRITAIDKEQISSVKKSLPYFIAILITSIVIALVVTNRNTEVNIGNPYECEECKELARACTEHKEFDSLQATKSKLNNQLKHYGKYIENGEEYYTYYIYGESYYNINCDFCTKNKSECKGCYYTKIAMLNYIKDTINEEYSRLCESCKKLRYPYCGNDIQYITDCIINKIK